ncbi:type II secretion system protein [Aliagarivorans marinus]|uniref:type II secretion system protein n=1 Tax=Aliagarivorans marinus TaxID=561965 RepID=UPI00040275FB
MVITIIIIGVLAVTVLPRFNRSGYGEASLAEQLRSAAQLVQTQNMNHRGQQFCLQIESSYYYLSYISGGICSTTTYASRDASIKSNVEQHAYPSGVNVSPIGTLIFDRDGLANLSQLTISSSSETYKLKINSGGYIYVD